MMEASQLYSTHIQVLAMAITDEYRETMLLKHSYVCWIIDHTVTTLCITSTHQTPIQRL
jgi:hypothetical protein